MKFLKSAFNERLKNWQKTRENSCLGLNKHTNIIKILYIKIP